MKLLVTNPNFLILDEPTNDFDIESLNVLEEFLEKFSGCLVLVSHDRYFMDHLVNQLFVFEGDGKIRLFNGNYSDYRIWADEQQEGTSPEVVPVSDKQAQKPSAENKKVSFKEKQEYEKLQAEIDALEKQKAEIAALFDGGTTDHVTIRKWSEQIQSITNEIEAKMARWMELEEIINR